MTVDYYKLDQIVTLIVAAMLNVVSSLNTASGSYNVTVDLTNMFLSIPKSTSHLPGKDNSPHSLSCSKPVNSLALSQSSL